MVTQVPRGGLTSLERRLIAYVRRGEWLDLAGDEAVDEDAMKSWGESRICQASVIRDILRGRLAAHPDPHGLRLRGGKITGRLDLENLTTDINLELKDCLLEEGIVARDARMDTVVLDGCQVEHSDDAPLDGARLTCRQLFLTGARVICHADAPAVFLVGAHIGGYLLLEGAKLCTGSGSALFADGMHVGHSVYLRDKFAATGVGKDGAVRLLGAHIGGDLDCSGAKLCNDSGPALNADGLHVGQAMFLRYGFTATATSSSDLGAVRLVGAHIGLNLDCRGAKLRNDSGPALQANSLQVGQNLYLDDGFTATGGGEGADDVAVDLTATRVGGVFRYDPERLEHKADPRRRLAVNGLTYPGVPERISAEGWQKLLRDGTQRYAAQPYQQLAAGYRARGEDRQARRTLMLQRDDQLARTRPGRLERWWGKITKVTLGYGYQPWRALLFLAAVVAVSCLLTVLLGAHGALTQTKSTAAPGQSCTVVQQVSVGLDLNLPVGTSVARASCDLNRDSASTTGAWLTAVGWVLRVLAWVFAALFIAGFTSAVRKT